MTARTGALALRLAALGLGTVAALCAVELAVRVLGPPAVERGGVALRLFEEERERASDLFQLDADLGYVPVFGTRWYDEHGVVPNRYALDDRRGRQRVLFLGDSVTFRGEIVRALRKLHGTADHEYWNGGVEAYNTTQEVLYFERHLARTLPDHVVLTFHPNDFTSTPITFETDGRLHVVVPGADRSQVNVWLFRHSHAYRFWIGKTHAEDWSVAAREICASLERLAGLTRAGEVRLSVVVLPFLRPLHEWSPSQHERHRWILETLRSLEVESFDLQPAMERALEDGVDVNESPGDHDHPSAAVAAYFAADLRAMGLFEPVDPTGRARDGQRP